MPSSLSPGRATVDSVRHGLRTAGILSSLLVAVANLVPTVAGQLAHPTPAMVGLAVILLQEVLVLACLVGQRFTTRAVTLNGVLLVVGTLAMIPWRHLVQPINLWAPGYWGLPWAALVVATLSRRRYVAVLTATFTGLMCVDLVALAASGRRFDGLTTEPATGFLNPVAIMALFADGLLQLARRADALDREREASERRQAATSHAAEGRREAARLLHDHVLHALQALSRASGLDPDQVRSECGTAVAATDQRHGLAGDLGRLEAVLVTDPAVERLAADVHGTTKPLPAPVIEALAGAAHEALANVERHARARNCHIEVSDDGEQWTCRITDDGRGFDPDAVPARRLGLQRSIRERMDAVGGQAQVSSRPGQGTTVELRWPRFDELPPPSRDDVTVRGVLARTSWPNLLSGLVLTAQLSGLMRPSWPTRLAVLVLFAVGAHYILAVRHRPLRWPDALVLLGTSFAVWGVNLWTAPDHIEGVHHLWLAWGCAALANLVVLQAGLRRGAVVVVGWGLVTTVMLGTRYHWQVDWSELHVAITVGVGEGAIALVALATAERILHHAAQQQHRARQAQLATARLVHSWHLESYWSRRVTAEVLPLLAEVAAGSRPVDEPGLDVRARQLEAGLRDELVLGPGNARLTAALTALRQAGWQVTAAVGGDDDPAVCRSLAQVAEGLGGPARRGQPVTLSCSGERGFVVVAEPAREQAARLGTRFAPPAHQVLAAEEFLRIGTVPAGA